MPAVGHPLVRSALAMAYRLLLLAERSWRRLDSHELLPLVRAGVRFKDAASSAKMIR